MSEFMERMSDRLDEAVIEVKTGARKVTEELSERAEKALRSEAGAVDIVVILLLIVLVIALVAIFHKQLGDLVNKVFGKLNTAVDKNGGA